MFVRRTLGQFVASVQRLQLGGSCNGAKLYPIPVNKEIQWKKISKRNKMSPHHDIATVPFFSVLLPFSATISIFFYQQQFALKIYF